MPPHTVLDQIVEIIGRKNVMQANRLKRFLKSCNAEYLKSAESYLAMIADVVAPGEKGPSHLAACYLQVVKQLFEEQVKFMRSGVYSSCTAAEAYQKVYSDKEYMDRYMVGLAVSQFFWPNHRDIFNFFRSNVSGAKGGDYLEIGPGHGLFLLESIKTGCFDTVTVLDISQASLDLCRRLIEHEYGNTKAGIKYLLEDVTTFGSDRNYDFVAMGEVLEHVERPDKIMAGLFGLVTPGGLAFVSTCANAPAVDHIYLFNNVAEMREMVLSPGFEMVSELVLPHEGVAAEEAETKRLTINYCAILRKP